MTLKLRQIHDALGGEAREKRKRLAEIKRGVEERNSQVSTAHILFMVRGCFSDVRRIASGERDLAGSGQRSEWLHDEVFLLLRMGWEHQRANAWLPPCLHNVMLVEHVEKTTTKIYLCTANSFRLLQKRQQ